MALIEKGGYHELTQIASEFKWTIYNFSLFDQENGDSIDSQTFLLSNGIKWMISLYPNGDDERRKSYVSIFLTCLSNVNITVQCELVMSIGLKFSLVSHKFKYNYEYDALNNGFGFPEFIKRDHKLLVDLQENNDILTITVKINFPNASPETNCINLQNDFKLLYESKEMSDVILESNDGNKHKAHKVILACRSKVFSAMFQHNMKESQDNTVKIKDIDSITLQAMLYFIYTGELFSMVGKIIDKLLIAADKYELIQLKMMCINYLCDTMDNNDVLSLIGLADTYNFSDLKIKAKAHFLKNHKEILSDIESLKNLKDLSKDTIEELLCALSSSLSL